MRKVFQNQLVEVERLRLWRAWIKKHKKPTRTETEAFAAVTGCELEVYRKSIATLPDPKKPEEPTLFDLSAYPKMPRKPRPRKPKDPNQVNRGRGPKPGRR